MFKLKDDLMRANEFKPNISLFDQKDKCLFGSIRLDACWLNINSFQGEILTDERQITELIDL